MTTRHEAQDPDLPPLNYDLQQIIAVISDPRRLARLDLIGIHVDIREPQIYIPERLDLC